MVCGDWVVMWRKANNRLMGSDISEMSEELKSACEKVTRFWPDTFDEGR